LRKRDTFRLYSDTLFLRHSARIGRTEGLGTYYFLIWSFVIEKDVRFSRKTCRFVDSSTDVLREKKEGRKLVQGHQRLVLRRCGLRDRSLNHCAVPVRSRWICVAWLELTFQTCFRQRMMFEREMKRNLKSNLRRRRPLMDRAALRGLKPFEADNIQ
jgi:hypothetical protein